MVFRIYYKLIVIEFIKTLQNVQISFTIILSFLSFCGKVPSCFVLSEELGPDSGLVKPYQSKPFPTAGLYAFTIPRRSANTAVIIQAMVLSRGHPTTLALILSSKFENQFY